MILRKLKRIDWTLVAIGLIVTSIIGGIVFLVIASGKSIKAIHEQKNSFYLECVEKTQDVPFCANSILNKELPT